MKVKREIWIDSTPEKVWLWLTEFNKIQTWNESLVEEKLVSKGVPGEGFKSDILIREGGKDNWYGSIIKVFKCPTNLQIQLTGGNLGDNPMTIDYELEPLNNGVLLHYISEWLPNGIVLTLMHPIIKIMANRNAKKCLEQLKKEVELAP